MSDNGKDTDEFPIPDIVLRDAYVRAAREVWAFREKFVANTNHVELARFYCGPQYSFVPTDVLRDRISDCCKSPDKHGGGWAAAGGHGPGKGVRPNPEWYQNYLASAWWQDRKKKFLEFWEWKCALCNLSNNLEVHHRTYLRLGAEQDNDCVVLCRKCHKRHHKWVQTPADKENKTLF